MSAVEKECPGCAMMVEADATECPICGYKFPKQSMGTKIMAWIMIMLLIWWLVF